MSSSLRTPKLDTPNLANTLTGYRTRHPSTGHTEGLGIGREGGGGRGGLYWRVMAWASWSKQTKLEVQSTSQSLVLAFAGSPPATFTQPSARRRPDRTPGNEFPAGKKLLISYDISLLTVMIAFRASFHAPRTHTSPSGGVQRGCAS